MRRVDLTLRTDRSFEIPVHSGYQIYSSLLGLMKESDPNVSQRVHDSTTTALSLGDLRGPFQSTRKPYRKQVIPHERYRLQIGITDPHDDEVFRHLILPILTDRKELPLHQGSFFVEQIRDQMVSVDDLVQQTQRYEQPTLSFDFLTPTCIQYRNSRVTEMYPHRIAVFHSLLSKWNLLSPADLRMGVSRDDFGRYIIERPDLRQLTTYSVQVNTIMDPKKGHPRPLFRQGFTGRCIYFFTSNAPEGFRNATLLLAMFAEFSGVGSSVARGCGQVDVTIQDSVNEE
ncbi:MULTISPECIES: CRISPR system precrRNA processing endoribonuclease RAMP protein Cas6 [unclassified Methanoculleus]|jgi:CRISPR-associated endoribonuclease Cas6|uniref:CRISPR system precrRNA processing endoribonuclease RAMP protein Cas6 n=1 Tax=unclassified Methanoculleus TaxID=2619537 RepID=UPI002600175C|nr:CRISPR system precrRNA processing endoribonuclease RAMP protein Cas6 [Methanoculleus sp. UBA377]